MHWWVCGQSGISEIAGHCLTMSSDRIRQLIDAAAKGDRDSLELLLNQHRERLRRFLRFRMDRRLARRLDDSDVIQDTLLEASQRFAEYALEPTVPFYVWLRYLTSQRLAQLHRTHLQTQQRDVRREAEDEGAASSTNLADLLESQLTSPSVRLMRTEIRRKLFEALDQMESMDREILLLRHFEQLTNQEAARILGISETAASNRFVRAIERLEVILRPYAPEMK